MLNTSPGALLTLEDDGKIPECRMQSAETCLDFVRRTIDADTKRNKKRALVAGLVDGNAPYNGFKLREQNRADACNVNWGTGRATWEASVGAFYDLATQAPGIAQVETSHGTPEQQVWWSRILSAEVDLTFKQYKPWDSQEQMSQSEMVLYGVGPMYFEDAHKPFPTAVTAGSLYVPDLTPSDLDLWEIAFITFDYYPPKLYEFIQNESVAQSIGWRVNYTKKVIVRAVDKKSSETRQRGWEWYQNEMKTNSFDYVSNILVCKLTHVFWREFDGRVSHGIIQRDDVGEGADYLFLSVGRYDNFYQAIHPMYFDKGRGGLHYNVTGLGVKQYGAVEYENRLLCGLMDQAFAPKILFTPGSQESATKFQLQRYGQYALLSPGITATQTPIQGLMQDGLAMFRTSSEIMRSNLSQYRQTVPMDRPGNPETAKEVMLKASQSGSLSNTTFARYYSQRDLLLAEIVRRLCNLNSSDKIAKDFQQRCSFKGVPLECFGRIKSVSAVRVVGGGSEFMRRSTSQDILPLIQRLPENGQQNLLDDYISSHAGQNAVERYNPKSPMSEVSGDQRERAGNQVAGMKIGKPATFSPSQDALIFASTYIQACVQALNSVQQGADPASVVGFVELAAPAALTQIQRMVGDPLRASIVTALQKQIKRIGSMVDQLKKMMSDRAKKVQQQQQKTAMALNDQQLKQLETQSKIHDRAIKTQASIEDKKLRTQAALEDANVKTQSELARADATTATNIRLNQAKTHSDIQEKRKKSKETKDTKKKNG